MCLRVGPSYVSEGRSFIFHFWVLGLTVMCVVYIFVVNCDVFCVYFWG